MARIPKKKTVPVSSGFRGRRSTDMRMFYRSSPWAEWWETFYLSYDSDGSYKFKTLRGFVKHIATSPAQTHFLTWYLGTKEAALEEDGTDHRQRLYPYATGGPQDWLEKRRTGGWYTRETMRRAFPEWRHRMNALEALRETGTYTAKDLVRYEEMQAQLDEEFKGRFFIPGARIEQGAARAKLYLALTAEIDELKKRAHERFRGSLGINLEDVSGLVQILTSTAINSGERQDGIGQALHGIVKTVLAKSQRLNLPLPPGVEEVVIDAAESASSRKKLQ